MNSTNHTDEGATILVLGPVAEQLGGMASVIGQVLGLDFGERFRLRLFANTESPSNDEPFQSKVWRHVRHAVRLGNTVENENARLIHIHTCSGFSFYRSLLDMLVARRVGCPAVLHIHGAAFDEFYRDSSILARRVIRWGLARAETVVALSQQWRDRLVEISPSANVTVVENAVEIPEPRIAPTADGKCRFALLAKMDTWKGIDDLLDACTVLSRGERETLTITLAGPGGSAGDEATIRRKISERGLAGTVRYIGPVRGEKKATLLREASAYVQPSHNEGMPISVLEAFSYGLPVVGTTVGAMPEIVGATESGVLVPPREPAALAAALAAMASDPKWRETLGRNARRLAETRFDLLRLRDDMVRVYDRILTRGC